MKFKKTRISVYNSTKGGVGKTVHAVSEAMGKAEYCGTQDGYHAILLLTCDENMSFKHFFEESDVEKSSYKYKDYTKTKNLIVPDNVLFLYHYVDFDKKSFRSAKQIKEEMYKDVEKHGDTYFYNKNKDGKLIPISDIIIDLPARHNTNYESDTMTIVHQMGDYVSLVSSVNRLETLLKEEKKIKNLIKKTQYNFLINVTASNKRVSAKERAMATELIQSLEKKYDYKINIIESTYFNFDYHLRNSINFMADKDTLKSIKEYVYKRGSRFENTKGARIRSGREILLPIVEKLSGIEDMLEKLD